MSLPGLSSLAGIAGGLSLSFSGTVTVGTATIGGKGFAVVQHGYANAAKSISGSIIGSRSPTSASGFTIIGIFWELASPPGTQATSLIVTGDSSALSAHMTIGGVNQNLGPGNYDGTNTTYSSGSSQANPFGADSSVAAVVIS